MSPNVFGRGQSPARAGRESERILPWEYRFLTDLGNAPMISRVDRAGIEA